MKKWLWLLPIAALLVLAACSMPGNVYLRFTFAVDPLNWDCSDPNIDTPGVIDELDMGFDYLTLPGDYYFEYQAIDAVWYPIYYTLTAHKGAGSPGEDAIFIMYLPNPGYPVFWQHQGLAPSSGSSTPTTAWRSVLQSGSTFDKSGYEFKQLGEYSQSKGGYTMTVRYGVWEAKK